MRKLRSVTLIGCLMLFCNLSMAAKLCGKISQDKAWESGVFSVIDSAGITVATTQLIASGGMGCTGTFDDGTYMIRFNGAHVKSIVPFENVYGCVTQAYKFEGADPIVVVFDNGRPPFTNNEFCRPLA